MKKFIIKSLLFISVLLFSFVFIEIYLQFFPSAFQLKANYLKNNKSKIEVLILGSSHNQTAINPEFISLTTANIAFSGQDVSLDNKLLKKEITSLPNLKFVLLELSYHTLEMKNNTDYERNPLYLRFYNINNFERGLHLKDYSIFLSDPKLYLKVLNPFFKMPLFNKYGFELKISKYEKSMNRFQNLNYDTSKIDKDYKNAFIERHKYQDLSAFNLNTILFNNLIELCLSKNIKPIIVIPPVYKNYFTQMIKEKKCRSDKFLLSTTKKHPDILVIDFENTEFFNVRDFMNEDHLNPEGAKKFSKIINSVILNSYK